MAGVFYMVQSVHHDLTAEISSTGTNIKYSIQMHAYYSIGTAFTPLPFADNRHYV